jgi:hypothetical protein
MKLSRYVFLVGALILAACSTGTIGSGDNIDPSPGPGPMAVDGVCPFHVTRGNANSWLLVEPEMHLVYWGNYPANDAATYQFVWDALLNKETVLQRLSEYGIRGGTFDTNQYNNNINATLPNPDGGAPAIEKNDAGIVELDDNLIPTELNNEILAGELPYPNDNTVYMIMLPPGTSTHNLLSGDAGYHYFSSYNGQRYTYGVIGYRGADWNGTDEVVSHELAESATDPDTSTGWRDYTLGHYNDEIADICVWIPVSYGFYGYTVQKYWNQDLCVCQ